ncbi:hypothetical protein [Streptomyces olivaceus]|uniref:hypothetical protein n=1 Tax=Streptomyces olivaceus TaxID=47716 RepID=UPI0036307E95
MPCACQKNRLTFEVVPDGGNAKRAAFTGRSQGTAEAVADRYPTSIVRDKDGQAVYFSWPKGSYDVVLQGGKGDVVLTSSERGRLKAMADDYAGNNAVVRSTANGSVVYPLASALEALQTKTAPGAAPA